uniref:Uncharacterized protein n=1 Tax=Schistosoma mansoni TaxID=6183 RepID=A0A5K4F463_SCHMA
MNDSSYNNQLIEQTKHFNSNRIDAEHFVDIDSGYFIYLKQYYSSFKPLPLLLLIIIIIMAYSGYSTDNSDSDQTNTYPLKEKSTLKKRSKRNHHRKRFGRMAKSWKFMKLRKLWERDMAKQRSISAPFVSIKANNK